MQYLFRPDGRLAVDAAGRARLGASGEPCCCDGTCPNYVRVVWCCDPLRVAWLWMNRPECAGHIPTLPVIPLDGPVTVALGAPGQNQVSNCWKTDPVPEGNVRTFAAIPPGEIVVWDADGTPEIVDNCGDPRCGPCPECCGSRTMPGGCGGWASPDAGAGTCCECGDDYTLTITETMRASGRATAYADPCTTFPSIGEGPSWDVEITRTATFVFGCEEVTEDGVTFLRRKVTGSSVLRRVRRGHYARIEFQVPRDNFDPTPCALISFQPGHRTVEESAEFVRSWNELAIGGEGCGLTRDQVAVAGPEDWGLSRPGLSMGAFQAAGRFDLGECFGSLTQYIGPCDAILGGVDAWSCRMGTAPIGFEVQWTGSRNCDGGSYSETGSFQAANVLLRADVVVQQLGNPNSGIPFEGTWGGDEAGEWTYGVAWQKSAGRACFVDPCVAQGGEGTGKVMARRMGNGVKSKAGTMTREGLLEWASSKVASTMGGCGGCGKTYA